MTTNTNRWRRCPFCGSEVDPKRVTSREDYYKIFPSGDGCVLVTCGECNTQMYEFTGVEPPYLPYEDLVENLRNKWNTRKKGARK